MLLLGGILLAIFVVPWPWGLATVIGGGVLDVAESLLLLRWTRRRRAETGIEALIGRTAVVTAPCGPNGYVRVGGELWQARSERGVDRGDTVTIRGADGLILLVD
jgi:membrane-bound serine protease (ClpP class)